jgi:phosphomannomutase
MSEDLAAKYGVPFFRSKVGEAHVADLMTQHDAVFGGEGNGGPIDPRVGYVRDSFIGMALVLEAMAERELPLSRLAAELPQYRIFKTAIGLAPERVEQALDRLESLFSDARPDHLDGLRLDWPRKWLLVRASNTEPIVRLIAEAPTQDEAESLCQAAIRAVANP